MEAPPHVIGDNTVDCMRSGIVYGTASMLEGLCGRIEEELGSICRVVATGGETVEVRGGTVYIDGSPLDESAYWRGAIYGDFGPVTVPEGEVFVMGDNRNASKDSRNASVGTIPLWRIVGRVRAVFLPPGSARWL